MDLIGQQSMDAVTSAIREFAMQSDFGPGGVFIEPRAPECVLNSLIEEADRRVPSLNIRGRLEQVARSRNLELARVLDPQLPSSHRLWELMAQLEGEGGGHVVVPSRAHLTSVGPSGLAVLHRITTMRTAHIYYLTSGRQIPPRQPIPARLPATDEVVLVQSRLDGETLPKRLDAIKVLTDRMWIDQMVPVEQLYKELVDDANRAARAARERGFGPDGNDGYIRLLHRSDDLLVVELEETRSRPDPPSGTLKALCANAIRYTERGRTITRCTLGREYAVPFEHAGARQ
ncbi:hypothetical protein GCM10023319_19350 [Nocardia iowensis]